MALSDLRGLVLTHGHHLVPGYPGTTYKYLIYGHFPKIVLKLKIRETQNQGTQNPEKSKSRNSKSGKLKSRETQKPETQNLGNLKYGHM